jgi:hypothetical protein
VAELVTDESIWLVLSLQQPPVKVCSCATLLLLCAVQVLSDEGARQAYNARLETALADEEDDYTGAQSVISDRMTML